ncbi:MAG: hypothetical protein DRO94_04825 [Candidatus Altiarchaeales archaeon]|nr:MAG: hypothetical protein DRO95_05780 [Candidatus Altiarchaeales archaeon]RLI93613.1 MAG: hypothetical protein DRO94_04825 [Candidatus Altiarchaeales archaeon]
MARRKKSDKKPGRSKEKERVTKRGDKEDIVEEDKINLQIDKNLINLIMTAIIFFIIGFIVAGSMGFDLTSKSISVTNVTTTIATTIPKEETLNVIILNDKRCSECVNLIKRLIPQLRDLFPRMNVKEIDYSSDEGKDLYNTLNLKYLPAILFEESVKEYANYNSIQRYLEKRGNYLSLRIGANFDPTAEICDNGIDDNGNGLIDCNDSDCEHMWVCMPKLEKPRVELFVMAFCPYGIQMEKGILPVVNLLEDKIDFEVKFCSYAMHGKKELDEQLNQYCIQRDFKDKYIPYLTCFLKEGDTNQCLTEIGINQEELNECIQQVDTKYKVTEKYNDKSTWLNGRFPVFDVYKEDNDKYKVTGSPTLVINGVVARTRRDPASLLHAICLGFKDKPEECNENLSSVTPSPGFGFSGSGSGSSGSCS